MKIKLYDIPTYFAATPYGCGAYGAGSYNEGENSCVTQTSTSNDPSLANTGFDVLIPLAIAALLVIASVGYIVVKIFKKRK